MWIRIRRQVLAMTVGVVVSFMGMPSFAQGFHIHMQTFGHGRHGPSFVPDICGGAFYPQPCFVGCGCPYCVDWSPPLLIASAPHLLNFPAPIDPAVDLGDGAIAIRPNRQEAFDDVDEIRRRVAVLKPSTPQGRVRADRLIAEGDDAFADQVFGRAAAKYRDAVAKAPDYPAAHFRLAHIYVAIRQYNLALKSVLTALELAGTSRRDGFSLEGIYRGNAMARGQHLDRLLDASLREPDDGGLLFLLGMTWHYGSNPLKAREYFHKAGELPGNHQAYVHYFLPIRQIAEPDPPAGAVN